MSRRTWIKVKRGLITDPKHRNTIGIRIWLYQYLLDKADWETGIVYEWRDKDEADDIHMPWRTLQSQRQQLEKDGYITCKLKGDHQDIVIHNWTNPREYSGETYNEKESTPTCVPLEDDEGTRKSTRKGSRKSRTPTLKSHITDHNTEYTEVTQLKYVQILSSITKLDYKMSNNFGRLAKAAKQLFRAGYTPEQIVQHYSANGSWYKKDWRGQKRQPPKPEYIIETIGEYCEQPIDYEAEADKRAAEAKARLERAKNG